MRLKIASFNTWNSVRNKYNIEDKSLIIFNHLKKEDIDVIGFQELNFLSTKSLKELLQKYYSYGKYRFTNFFKRFIANENNTIFSKYEIKKKKTIRLPFIPKLKYLKKSINFKHWSLFPRLVTIVIIRTDDKNICIMNTHLEYKITSLKKKQLTYIKNIISKYIEKYPTILMGDFNIELDNSYFKEFINDLKKIGMYRVEINKNTYGNNRCGDIIDNIFISKDFNVSKKGIYNKGDISKISDHFMIFVECSLD